MLRVGQWEVGISRAQTMWTCFNYFQSRTDPDPLFGQTAMHSPRTKTDEVWVPSVVVIG